MADQPVAVIDPWTGRMHSGYVFDYPRARDCLGVLREQPKQTETLVRQYAETCRETNKA